MAANAEVHKKMSFEGYFEFRELRERARRKEEEEEEKKVKYPFGDLNIAPEPAEDWLSKDARYRVIPQLESKIAPVLEQLKRLLAAKMREVAVRELLASGILTKPEYHLFTTHLHSLKAKTETERAKLGILFLKRTPKILWSGYDLGTYAGVIRFYREKLQKMKTPPKGSFYFDKIPALDVAIRDALSLDGRKVALPRSFRSLPCKPKKNDGCVSPV